MKKIILGIAIGLSIAGVAVLASELLIDANSISYEGEYTNKTNVADALTEILENQQGSLVCPDGYTCDYQKNMYTVTFETNGGTIIKSNMNVYYDEIYGQYEDLYIPVKTGYVFNGWYLDSSFKKYVNNDTKVKTASNHTLYAKWGSPITVTFNANGGKVNPGTKEVALEGRYGVLPRGYKEGYILEGWYSDSELTNKVNESTTVTNENNHTLYAKWVLGNTPLYDVVLSKLDTSKKSNDFNYGSASSASNGQGVYEYNGDISSDGGELPIYFYRGNITNNNVLFAGYCWKIVRTTGTGGTKLIYAGAPTGSAPNQSCNSTSPMFSAKTFLGDAKISHYTYEMNKLHGVGTDSKMKSYIEGEGSGEWFGSSNFAGNNNAYYDMIEDTPYCIDRRYTLNISTSLIDDGDMIAGQMYYGTYVRKKKAYKPTLYCYHKTKNNTDKLTVKNGQLKKKIALLNADEMMLAGGGDFSNSSFYLYTSDSWWLLSPAWDNYGFLSNCDSRTMAFFTSNTIYDIYSSYSYGIRPVLSLKLDVKVSGGNGSSSSPYVVNPN